MNVGEPLQAIELRLPWATVPPPVPPSLVTELPLSSSTWAAVARVHADPNTLQACVAALAADGAVGSADAAADAAVSAAEGDVAAGGVDGDHARLWAGARLLASRFDLSGSLDQLADGCGVSVRQVSRSLQRFTSSLTVPFSQWRDSTRRIRVKMAVMGLSADGASVADVAAAVGYGSADAMARAFRDVGIPAPSQVRDELPADARGLADSGVVTLRWHDVSGVSVARPC